jgi:hypothetical protein
VEGRFARFRATQFPTFVRFRSLLGALMPSARIKTRAVEDALPLAQDLRTRGFVVQIVSPDQAANEPVDLEVTLEECEPEAALRQADATPDADDLHVFVAPGALTDGHRPIKIVPLVPEMPANIVRLPNPAAQMETQKPEKPALLEEATKLEESAPAGPVVPLPVAAQPQVLPVITASVPMPETPQPVALVAKEPEAPKVQEIPILSPAVWGTRVETEPVVSKPRKRGFYREAAKSLGVWLERAGADDRMLLKAAMVVAVGAVLTLSVLVLGATSYRATPLPKTVESASESAARAPARVIPVVSAPRPKRAVVPARVSEPKRRAHNPEEDVVAKDVVIRYRQLPAPISAKKNSAVKRYSDMQ